MANAGADKNYQDFDPASQWISEPGVEILVVELPGFKKDQLRVQVTASRKLRLTGERPAGGNKWIRFRKEIPIPPNVDVDSIAARFVGGKLYVEHPKEEPKEPETKPPTPPEKPVARAHDQPETRREDSKSTIEEKKPEEKKPGIEQRVGAKTTQPIRTIPEKGDEEKKPGIGTKTGQLRPEERKEAKNGESGQAEDTCPLVCERKANVGWMVKDSTDKQLTLFNLVAVVLIILLILLYARNAVRRSWGNLKDE